MGAQPQSATAVVTVPPGLDRQVQELLFQLLSGALQVLNAAGCALVGGHTGEGQELTLGFAINAWVDANLAGVTRKGGLRAGDVLLLTKPLGTGTLFAAHPRSSGLPQFRGRWVHLALDSMAMSNQAATAVLARHCVTACTDVTGFGLLGHMLEMAQASQVGVTLDLAALPVLDGAEACLAAGVVSSLAPANRRTQAAFHNPQAFSQHPRFALLFDPQTAGGLLASVPAHQAPRCLDALRAAGYAQAAAIGEVTALAAPLTPVSLRG